MSKKSDKAHEPKQNQGDDLKAEDTNIEVKSGTVDETQTAEAASTAQTGETETAEGAADQQKEVTETDILKIYLQQSMGELKRAKSELTVQQKEAEDAKSEAIAIKEKLESLRCEYENFRRRTAQEKENLLSDAVVKSVGALLPALDSLEKAVDFAQTNPESFKQGVEMTLKQLTDGFKALGVTEIEAQGAEFDPERHNAVMHVQDKAMSESVVAEVFQKGYAIGDKVIRHSVVKVAN
jgi:molecular chaperone GrpE